MSNPPPTDPGAPPSEPCHHPRRDGCVYCPSCGDRLPVVVEPRGFAASLFAPLDWLASIFTPTSATPDLDVTLNLEAIRTGDPERTRQALDHLQSLAPAAREIRPTIEHLTHHDDRDIAHRARDLLEAMDNL